MASTKNDKRLTAVTTEEEKTLNKNNTMYNSMIHDSQRFYDEQIKASKDYADKQSQLQQEQTDFAVEKIGQQKEQANKDYVKEQSGSYADWQKQSNQYGANAEAMADQGMANTGYSESSQVSMYNTYQNRVATAREVFMKANLNYDNMMKEAILQNNVVQAEIAYNALKDQLSLALQGMQYKNSLLEAQANKQLEIKNMYHGQYMDVLNQINTENALAEQIRQYNATLAEQKRQHNETLAEQKRQHNETLAEQKRQFNIQQSKKASGSGGGSGSKKSSGKSGNSDNNNYSNNNNSVPTFTSYEQASEYMRKQGVATGDGGLMTQSEWKRRKLSGSKSAEMQYSSYSEYLTYFVAWRMKNPQK